MAEIIDAHTHLGTCRVFDMEQSKDILFQEQQKWGINASVMQPFPGAPNPKEVHDTIAKLSKDNPGKVYGMMSLNPHVDPDNWKAEAERLVRDEGFVGLKMHTLGHSVNPLGNSAKMMFEMAKKLGVPLMVHTGYGIPFGLPSLLIPRAKEYPEVNIILAHAGWGNPLLAETLVTVAQHKNLYVEPSHVGAPEKKKLIDTLGPDRVLLGTDTSINIFTEMNQFTTLVPDEAAREKILGGNAKRLFGIR